MTCPTFSRLTYRDKQYCIADTKGFRRLPHPRDLFNLKDGMWCSSVGYDCEAIYGFTDDSLCIDSFIWRPAYKGKPKEEVMVGGRRIEPVEIFSTGEILRNGEWHEETHSDGFVYSNVNYPVSCINGEMLIVAYDYPDKEGESIKTTRLVLTLEDSKVVAEEPWVPGGNLHGLIDRTSRDYYAGDGYSKLLKEGFTKEELRATGKPCPFSLEEELKYLQEYLKDGQ
jgi:hypothetical protein